MEISTFNYWTGKTRLVEVEADKFTKKIAVRAMKKVLAENTDTAFFTGNVWQSKQVPGYQILPRQGKILRIEYNHALKKWEKATS